MVLLKKLQNRNGCRVGVKPDQTFIIILFLREKDKKKEDNEEIVGACQQEGEDV
jgi:hypothetical protein